MPNYTLQELSVSSNGYLTGNKNLIISRIFIDSRKVFSPEKALFIALKGEHHDGHKYVHELYKNGVKAFVVEKDFAIDNYPEASFIAVDNSLRALQAIAGMHRKNTSCPVLSIAGSNGKTIIKEWLYQVMSPDTLIVRSPRSYNSQVGVKQLDFILKIFPSPPNTRDRTWRGYKDVIAR